MSRLGKQGAYLLFGNKHLGHILLWRECKAFHNLLQLIKWRVRWTRGGVSVQKSCMCICQMNTMTNVKPYKHCVQSKAKKHTNLNPLLLTSEVYMHLLHNIDIYSMPVTLFDTTNTQMAYRYFWLDELSILAVFGTGWKDLGSWRINQLFLIVFKKSTLISWFAAFISSQTSTDHHTFSKRTIERKGVHMSSVKWYY